MEEPPEKGVLVRPWLFVGARWPCGLATTRTQLEKKRGKIEKKTKWLRWPSGNNKTYLCLWSNLRCYFGTYLTEPRFVIVMATDHREPGSDFGIGLGIWRFRIPEWGVGVPSAKWFQRLSFVWSRQKVYDLLMSN